MVRALVTLLGGVHAALEPDASACCPAVLASPHAALLYKPVSLALARTTRGDMLLPEPRVVPGGRQDGSKGEQLRDSDGEEEEDDTPSVPASEELWGRKLRRLLEQYVGSEVRGRGCPW